MSEVKSVCLFCGSSNAADPDFLQAAGDFGRQLGPPRACGLVYGGGGIGLMGAGGQGLPRRGRRRAGHHTGLLARRREVLYDDVETVIVKTMSERKRIMFEQSDAFAVSPRRHRHAGGSGRADLVAAAGAAFQADRVPEPEELLDPFFDLDRPYGRPAGDARLGRRHPGLGRQAGSGSCR